MPDRLLGLIAAVVLTLGFAYYSLWVLITVRAWCHSAQ
jgi:hypothetical protein